MSEFSLLLSKLVENYKENNEKINIDLYKIPIGISGRHIHLSQKDLDTLFGKGYELTPIKKLSQPGQFACKETLTIAARKGCIENVRIIGPVRSQSQVEILRADAFKLGIKPVLRLSGDLENTPGVTIIGAKGSIILKEGVIVAQRHIHFNNEQARVRGYKNGDIVSIRVGGQRSAILENVSIRVGDNGYLDCHIDQEEANALGLGPKDYAEIIR
ncbi:phosphate propanoyltransferase [Anaerococcus sp. WCA-380-WT-2B]|uniref:Phosphate propanoyltransferase n=1 Tax=Anaerococcus porci TaxID=2652269 RepID=A0A6N7VUE7_9FIRM|nr:phosphate propanoyltransferase [Anaerococcus porci]MSS77664.1 phosphate propanoyltransferase [Anaerococcus porci]